MKIKQAFTKQLVKTTIWYCYVNQLCKRLLLQSFSFFWGPHLLFLFRNGQYEIQNAFLPIEITYCEGTLDGHNLDKKW